MRRLLLIFFTLPLAVLLVLLAIANRGPVVLSLDPFSKETPALAFTAPFFVYLLAALMLGVLIGGAATWLKQGYHRRNERQFKREADQLRTEAERLKSTLPAPLPRL
jgi:uncharacterized integral membrane protein